MAYIAYGAGANAVFPSVYQDPKYPKDIVINGILFDTDTMTPKVGSNVMAWTGDYGVGTTRSWGVIDDDDIYYFGIIQNDHAGYQYATTFAPNHPYQARTTKSDGSDYSSTNDIERSGFWYAGPHMWARDWLEHPHKTTEINNTTNQYIYMIPNHDDMSSHGFYDASDRNMMWQNGVFRYQGVGSGSRLIDPETNSGNVFVSNVSSTTITCETIEAITYTTEVNLNTTTQVELYKPTTTDPHFIHRLTKCNNGDHFLLAHQGSGGIGCGMNPDLLRYDNSSNSITIEANNFAANYQRSYPMNLPSNVVYHQESDESTTSKKICYYLTWNYPGADNAAHVLSLIEMDVSANTISRTSCTYTVPAIGNTDDDLGTEGMNSGLGPDYYYDSRIMSASQDIDSQKYLFNFITCNSRPAAYHDPFYMILKINASNAASLTSVEGGAWLDILTASSKVVNNSDKIPWCVAPLNVEHTLMMVYTKYSTHLVKFDTSTESLSEVWMEDETMFNEVMWLPSGKVITSQFNSSFAEGSAAVDWHAPKPLQVWAQDLVYNVDITTDSNYVEYAGSDITNTLSISAQDGTDSNVSTDLTLQIIGPALFDNAATTKTITTSATEDVTETLTINDNGQIEIKVVEIQT